MEVLAVASEIFPLVKTGGLADVTGALPLALTAQGVRVRTIVPGYRSLLGGFSGVEPVLHYPHFFGGGAAILQVEHAGLDLLVLDAPHLFDRDGSPYADPSGADWPDNWRRFAAFGRAAADVAQGRMESYRPDIVHAHDWQAGMALAYLRYDGGTLPSVMTIHNLAFQGQFDPAIFPELGLPSHAFSIHGVEYYGAVGYLKAGLQAATEITTVSPTYAREIRTPEAGMGLHGLLAARASSLHGIVNGIDTEVWNPTTDPHLVSIYDAESPEKRRPNKREVERRFGLSEDDSPIFAVISRLTWQKGMDMLAAEVEEISTAGARLAVLGSGDGALEAAFIDAAARHPGRVAVIIGYDEPLSHLIQGGADAILVPSRFEPCGLTQLCGLHYGCVPIVARTGGLADTIIDANEAALAAGVATGFQFSPLTPAALGEASRRAVEAYYHPTQWATIQGQGMKTDVSWSRSAARYAELYSSMLRAG